MCHESTALLISLIVVILVAGNRGDNHDLPIRSAMSAGLGPVNHEIGGIENEVVDSVFPQTPVLPANVNPGITSSRLHSHSPLNALSRGLTRLAGRSSPSLTAHVEMVGDAQYFPDIMGHITLTQVKNGPVMITGSIRNLPHAGLIGMHFHEHPAVPGNCAVVGEHFNPLHMRHGGENELIRHIGDEGNIIVDGPPGRGIARIAKSDFLISLNPGVINSVISRSLTVHFRTDDLGKGLNRESGKSGNSGEKIACGTVLLDQSA